MSPLPTESNRKLRQLAEEKLALSRTTISEALSLADTQTLLHELQVHQIELEMQNEELRQVIAASAEKDALLETYANLYEFATDIHDIKIAEKELRENQELLSSIIDSSPSFIFAFDLQQRFTLLNEAMAKFLGECKENVLGKSIGELFPKEIADTLIAANCHITATGESMSFEETVISNDHNDPRIFMTSKFPLFDVHRTIVGLGGVATDITEHKRAEQELCIAATAFESQEGIMITDINGVIQRVNNAFTRITGYTAEEIVGQTPRILKSGRHSTEFYAAMWKSLLQTGVWQGEIWDKHKSGRIYPKWMTISAAKTKDNATTHYIAVQSDISARKAAEAEIVSLTYYDPLTGLPNRRMFLDRLAQEIKKYERTRLPLALLMIDLDHFKEVNDALGHDQGDILLQEASQRLLGCIRDSDTLARLGGDEFIIILSNLQEASDAQHVAESIVDAMLLPFSLGDEFGYISASIGITICPDDTTDHGQLLKNADQAMYSAKSQGRSRYCYFTQTMQAAAENRLRLTNDLRVALSRGELELHYQPIINIVTGVINKAEALIRWNHPQIGLINPAQFIHIAEETGLINDIGNWVFQEGVRQVKKWRQHVHPDFQISINKSPAQFHAHNKSHKVWIDYLHALDLPGDCLVVEITEGLLMEAKGVSHQKLLEFKDQGIQVAIDDFGTGYSALSYLNKFDIDYLKIDQSFIRNITLHSSDIALCKAIIVMAHELGLKVVAEGVETLAQHKLLANAGCDYAQGYFYAKPMTAKNFDIWLANERG